MLQTKALYNLLRLNAAEDPSVKAEPWMIEDLRSVPSEELFRRLLKYDVELDEATFHQFADSSDTPEDLADLLFLDESSEEFDPFYLIIFELWRRLLPNKQTLSTFGDELDRRIALYDDELIQEALEDLIDLLNENAGEEGVFATISEYSAHDLEQFIKDYIAALQDSGHSEYASELIKGFPLVFSK